MKVKLLNDGGFGHLLRHIEFPIIVNGEYHDDVLVAVDDFELNAPSHDGYYLFSPDEYEVIDEI
ncbi:MULTISPECIES: hypothetical protein [Providencia]|uniref:hypothetical protein n=1 Tax=Providencia TaxID=586 RepID=UPI00065DC98E|nr:hypothetical protein [Providencia rettgeri]